MVKTLFPLVRLDYKKSIEIAKAVKIHGIVIRLQDLITKKGKLNSLFYKIEAIEGIHNFLNFEGVIILSLIMQDKLIKQCNPELYAKIINGISPDAFTTVDGETYNNEESFSMKELRRLSQETIELLKLCQGKLAIGQVKGCNRSQIKLHVKFLKSLGITNFIFHASDFLRNGDGDSVTKAKEFASEIKKHGTLFAYGIGSPKKMLEFSFADFYISYSHIIAARNGEYFEGFSRRKYSGKLSTKVAIFNLNQMMLKINKIKEQTKLFSGGKCKWAEEIEVRELTIKL